MAVSNAPIFPQTPTLTVAQIANGTGAFTFAGTTATTGLVAVAAGGTNGSKVEALNITNSDTNAYSLQLVIILSGGNQILLTTVNIPASSGFTTSAPSVSILNNAEFTGLSYDAAGNKYLYLPASATLYVGSTTTVTSGKFLSCAAVGALF